MGTVLAYYTVGAVASFFVLLKAFLADQTTSLEDQTSWSVLALVTLLWPITMPISLLELANKKDESISETNLTNLKILHPKPFNPIPLTVQKQQLRFLPIGYLLRQAGLISEFQIRRALQEQKSSLNHLRIGEIMAYYGWLPQETIDFFAEQLPKLHQHPEKQPLGQYLKMAKLLDDQQIQILLSEQRQTNLKFGELAVKKGWVKPETVNLLLHYVAKKPEASQVM